MWYGAPTIYPAREERAMKKRGKTNRVKAAFRSKMLRKYLRKSRGERRYGT
jgi:hypothetical protein